MKTPAAPYTAGAIQFSSKMISARALIIAAKSHFTSTAMVTRGFISKSSGRRRPRTHRICGKAPAFRFNRRSRAYRPSLTKALRLGWRRFGSGAPTGERPWRLG